MNGGHPVAERGKEENIFELINQGSTVEVTGAQQPNQGERKKSAVYLFFLDFLVLFYQEKSTEKQFKFIILQCLIQIETNSILDLIFH
jgi:hypothetical protein